MDWRNVAKRTEGLQTVESFSTAMGIHRNTAVTYIHHLRDNGFVRTGRGRRGKRIYEISPIKLRKVGTMGFFDMINENSHLKIRKPFEHRVYGKKMTPEEAIVRALETKDSRVILASMELFRGVKDWSILYKAAKSRGAGRHIGALHTLSRRYFRVRRIDGRILRRMRESKVRDRYIIPNARSDDFKDIEREWNVYIPFNKSDIRKLRE